MRILAVLPILPILLLVAACSRDKREPDPAAAPPASAETRAAAAVPAPTARPAPDAAPAHSVDCEVEVFGKVTGAPAGAKVWAYVAVGDCLADDARMLGRTPAAADGSFMLEVFPRWGADVSVCATVDAGEGKPAVRYGKNDKLLHAEGEGEVEFHVTVPLAEGPPHLFPETR